MESPREPETTEQSRPGWPESYRVPETEALQPLLERADALRARIDQLRPIHPELWETIGLKLRVAWTYHSNAIEGNTLTLGETDFFLRHGLTSEGKPLEDFLEARNHAEAIDLLRDVVSNNRPISESLLKELNALLLRGIEATPAINSLGHRIQKPTHPGQYKQQPNHVLQPDGTIHHYVEPLHVPQHMEQLVDWINDSLEAEHPVTVAAVAHYNLVRIHPFDDGNGRGARLLMNLILLRRGYPPTVIYKEDRRRYIETLSQADRGERTPFVTFVANSVIRTQETILGDLEGSS